mmetsp:Transcript_35074/g.104671  ORF Transcript_35074/g.104671 Transcript_35074/m.104671 type:complete len:125 (+) Transcript_35074:305-679(+)
MPNTELNGLTDLLSHLEEGYIGRGARRDGSGTSPSAGAGKRKRKTSGRLRADDDGDDGGGGDSHLQNPIRSPYRRPSTAIPSPSLSSSHSSALGRGTRCVLMNSPSSGRATRERRRRSDPSSTT